MMDKKSKFREKLYKEANDIREFYIKGILECNPDADVECIRDLEGPALIDWVAQTMFPRDPETDEILSPFNDEGAERIAKLYSTRGIEKP
jgi:hypothetical protein